MLVKVKYRVCYLQEHVADSLKQRLCVETRVLDKHEDYMGCLQEIGHWLETRELSCKKVEKNRLIDAMSLNSPKQSVNVFLFYFFYASQNFVVDK